MPGAGGEEGGGGPGSAGPRGLRRGRGHGGRGQRPGHRRERRVTAGRGAGEGAGADGALEEGTGRSLGSRGPWARGSSPHYAAAVRSRCLPRCPRLGSRSAGPASPQPSPDGPGPAPPRRPVPFAGPQPLLVQAPAFKRFGLLTQPLRLSRGLGSSDLLGAEKGTGTGLEAKTALERGTKGQRPERRCDRGRTRAERESAVEHSFASLLVFPPRRAERGRKEVGRKPPRVAVPVPRPAPWLDPGNQ